MRATRARAERSRGSAPKAAILTAAAIKNGVPVWALTGVKLAETGASFAGAGSSNPFELEPGAARQVGVKDVSNFGEAANGAAQLLATYHKQFGSWNAAFEAYNGGPGAVGKGYAYDQAHIESKLAEFGTSKSQLEAAERTRTVVSLGGLLGEIPKISPLYRLFHGEAPIPSFPGEGQLHLPEPSLENPLAPVEAAGSAIGSIGDLIGIITSGEFWLRALEIVGGAVLVVLGLKGLTGAEFPSVVPVPV